MTMCSEGVPAKFIKECKKVVASKVFFGEESLVEEFIVYEEYIQLENVYMGNIVMASVLEGIKKNFCIFDFISLKNSSVSIRSNMVRVTEKMFDALDCNSDNVYSYKHDQALNLIKLYDVIGIKNNIVEIGDK